MNVIDAAHRTIHDYPGGSESLGVRVGISPAVLRSKVNPNTSTHHLTLAEADRIMGVTGDFQILHSLAANHGFVLSLVSREPTCPILAAILQAQAAHGELSGVIEVAMRDGRISANEKADIEESALHAVSKVLAMVNALVAKAEPELRAVA